MTQAVSHAPAFQLVTVPAASQAGSSSSGCVYSRDEQPISDVNDLHRHQQRVRHVHCDTCSNRHRRRNVHIHSNQMLQRQQITCLQGAEIIRISCHPPCEFERVKGPEVWVCSDYIHVAPHEAHHLVRQPTRELNLIHLVSQSVSQSSQSASQSVSQQVNQSVNQSLVFTVV